MNSNDRQNHSSLASLLALPSEPATEFQRWRPGHSRDVKSESVAKVTPDLREADLRFLRAVLTHPNKPSSAYAKLSGLGTHQAIKARQRLITEGFLREIRVNTSARGRASVVLEPLSLARDFAECNERGG